MKNYVMLNPIWHLVINQYTYYGIANSYPGGRIPAVAETHTP